MQIAKGSYIETPMLVQGGKYASRDAHISCAETPITGENGKDTAAGGFQCVVSAAKAHSDEFGAASLRSLVGEFGVKRARDIDPARWPEFCRRAAAGTPLAA